MCDICMRLRTDIESYLEASNKEEHVGIHLRRNPRRNRNFSPWASALQSTTLYLPSSVMVKAMLPPGKGVAVWLIDVLFGRARVLTSAAGRGIFAIRLGSKKRWAKTRASHVLQEVLAQLEAVSSCPNSGADMHGKRDGGTDSSIKSTFAQTPFRRVLACISPWTSSCRSPSCSLCYGSLLFETRYWSSCEPHDLRTVDKLRVSHTCSVFLVPGRALRFLDFGLITQ